MKKLQYNSPVILTFFFISLAVLLLDTATNGLLTGTVFSVYRTSWRDPLEYIRLFTHVLGHANIDHFVNNMTLFLVVGPPMEEKYGSKSLLIAIAITAVVSGILQIALFPGYALLGASGIVFMLILLSSLSGMHGDKIPLTLVLVAIIYLGEQVYDILFIEDNVANLMHIVGGLVGTGFGFYMRKH